jgi:hypothetical protein
MPIADDGSPGSHPHSARPNWRPGDDDAEELLLQKIVDASRDGKGERQIAKLLGVSRMMFWRGKKLGAIPEGLYERLAEAGIGIKAKIWIGRFCETGELLDAEVECCPNCGHRLRARTKDIRRAIDILNKWIEDGRPGPNERPLGAAPAIVQPPAKDEPVVTGDKRDLDDGEPSP